MTRLSKDQLANYHSEGFVKGGRILNASELTVLRQKIDQLIVSLPSGNRPENMPSAHYRNKYFCNLFLSQPLVDIAEQILGPDVALFTSYIISKRPKDGLAVNWHQDGAYFPITPMETFTLWLAVDDSDQENGCMKVIPGSHRKRNLLRHQVDLQSNTTLPLSLSKIDLTKSVDVELKAGEFSVHDVYLWHGSNVNHSSRRRCGITLKYIPTYVKIDRSFVAPTGFDWSGLRLYLARGHPGNVNDYVNRSRVSG